MDLFNARLDDIPLEIETLDDSFEKAIARYDIPYRDGAILEDMGQKAHTLKVRCYFWDDGADHYTYNEHIKLVNHLADSEPVTLVHPKYGPLKGYIEQVSVRHDDRIMVAEVDLTFVEDSRTQLAAVEYEIVDVEAEAESYFYNSTQMIHEAIIADMYDSIGPEAGAIVELELDPELTIMEQLSGITSAARKYVMSIDTVVAGLEAQLTNVASLANSVTSTIDFAVNLPGRLTGAIFRCLDRYIATYDSLSTAPDRLMNSFQYAVDGLETRFGFAPQIKSAGAACGGVVLGRLLVADEQTRSQMKQSELTANFDGMGNYSSPAAVDSIMTVDQLESCLATYNAMVQAAVDADRMQESLKKLASQMVEYINTVKLEREKIRIVTVENPLPLHLVCLANGLPYSYAGRIQAINQIPQPNFTHGEIRIYGR